MAPGEAAVTRRPEGREQTMSTPCIITVAITGSVPTKKDSAAVPITVPEQIESTHAAYEAGAALVHVHVRNDDGTTTSDPEKFGRFLAGIRKHCPDMIVQFSTGGRSGMGKERGGMLHLKPEMASLTTGSVNFAKIIYENHPTLINDLASSMLAHDVKPEVEIFDLAMLYNAAKLVADGLLKAPVHVQFVLGIPGRAAGGSRGARVRARAARAHAARRDLDGGRHRPASAHGQRVDARARRALPHGARGQRALRQGAARGEQCRARATRGRADRANSAARWRLRPRRAGFSGYAPPDEQRRTTIREDAMELVYATILLALIEYIVMAALVGRARAKYGVHAPAMTGHPDFERANRVHVNTLENLIIFVPAVWIFATYTSAFCGRDPRRLVRRRVARCTPSVTCKPRRSAASAPASPASSIIVLVVGGLVGVARALI